MTLYVTIHPLPTVPVPPGNGGEESNTEKFLDPVFSVVNGAVIQTLKHAPGLSKYVAAMQGLDIVKSLAIGSYEGLETKDFVPSIENSFTGIVVSGLVDVGTEALLASSLLATTPAYVIAAVPVVAILVGAGLGYVLGELVEKAFQYLETYGPTLVGDAEQQASIFASNIEALSANLAAGMNTVMQNVVTGVSSVSDNPTDFFGHLSDVIANQITAEVDAAAVDVGNFLSDMGISYTPLTDTLSATENSIQNWVSGAVTAINTGSTNSADSMAAYQNYVTNNTSSAPADFISAIEAQIANAQGTAKPLQDGLTYQPDTGGDFTLTAADAFGPGTSSVETYDPAGELLSEKDTYADGSYKCPSGNFPSLLSRLSVSGKSACTLESLAIP